MEVNRIRRESLENKKCPKASHAMKCYKEDEEGVVKVCTLVEEYAEEYAKTKMVGVAINLIEMGLSNKEISTATHLTEEEVEKLRE